MSTLIKVSEVSELSGESRHRIILRPALLKGGLGGISLLNLVNSLTLLNYS